jgi:hypothetical protein
MLNLHVDHQSAYNSVKDLQMLDLINDMPPIVEAQHNWSDIEFNVLIYIP